MPLPFLAHLRSIGMTRRSYESLARPRLRLDQLLRSSAVALVLTTLPVAMSTGGLPLCWQTALAKDGSGGGGGAGGGGGGNGHGSGGNGHSGGGQGGDHGNGAGHGAGGQGRALGQDQDSGGQAGGAAGYHDVNEFVDSVRNGKALGLERHDERIDQARGRYAAALGRSYQVKQAGYVAGGHGELGPAAYRFSPEETEALMKRGWKGPSAGAGGFRNHGERVRTMVELAKRLGYGARVGALQANFGTPEENGIAALEAKLAAAEAAGDQAEVDRLEKELAEAIKNAKPGNGPDDSWATADLDVNDDGLVDKRDLQSLEQSGAGAGDADNAPPS
jgi:hypothetical protein